MYILEEFREVVQPDHPEEVNLGKCSDDVEFCVLWQLRLQFKREKSSVSDVSSSDSYRLSLWTAGRAALQRLRC